MRRIFYLFTVFKFALSEIVSINTIYITKRNGFRIYSMYFCEF